MSFKSLIKKLVKEVVEEVLLDEERKGEAPAQETSKEAYHEVEHEGTGLARTESKRELSREELTHDESFPRAVQEALVREVMQTGSIRPDVHFRRVQWECPACGLHMDRAVVAGLHDHYIDYTGSFSEERFRNSHACARCGFFGAAGPEALKRARREWQDYREVTGGEVNPEEWAAQQERDRFKRQMEFRDEPNVHSPKKDP